MRHQDENEPECSLPHARSSHPHPRTSTGCSSSLQDVCALVLSAGIQKFVDPTLFFGEPAIATLFNT